MRDAPVLRRSPIAILKAAHFQLIGLLARYDALGREESRKKHLLSHKIQQDLRIQLALEEVLFHPAVRSMNAELACRVVRRALQDHGELKVLLAELAELCFEDRSLDVKMHALKQCVLRHLDLEESQVFPCARTLPREALHALSDEMEELRDRLRRSQRQTRPPQRERPLFYPTLQDKDGAPEDDQDTPHSLGSPGESNERHPSDFESWGSE